MKLLLSVITFCILSLPPVSWALDLKLPRRVFQGDLIVGKVEAAATVKYQDKKLPVSSDGYFIIGVPRLQKTDLLITALRGKKKVSRTVMVMAYQWKIQRIDGLPKRHVNPPPKAVERIKIDNRKVRKIRQAKVHPVPLFLGGGFVAPVKGTVTGVYGSQRILNGQPRSPHSGLDIAAARGTAVVSPADGIVRLAVQDMYLMGNTLMVDHGLGLVSIFIHLESIDARVGDRVAQGDILARVGKTGRATGPHLHWGVSVGSTSIDPARLINKKKLPARP